MTSIVPDSNQAIEIIQTSSQDYWKVGFEVEVVLGTLGKKRFERYIYDPMDRATNAYCKAVARKLKKLTGFPWTAPGRQMQELDFYVIAEYDIDPLNFPVGIIAGVELITPPLPLSAAQEARDLIQEAIDWLGEVDAQFDPGVAHQCGWHINIDASGSELKIENFILAANELPHLATNERLSSRYAAPQRHSYGVALLRHLDHDSRCTLLGRFHLANMLNEHAGFGKQHAANFEKLDKGYVEMRHFSAGYFFEGPPLREILSDFISAFEMGHEAKNRQSERLLQRFRVLHDWSNRHLEVVHHDFSPMDISADYFGKISFKDEIIATSHFNGSWEISMPLKGNIDGILISRVQHKDVPRSIALLALDLAELQLAGFPLRTLSAKFNRAVASLKRKMIAGGLGTPVPMERGHWWPD